MCSYNHDRPDMALGGITPKQYLAMAAKPFYISGQCNFFWGGTFQDSHQLVSTQCTFRLDHHGLMCCVIHHRQALDAASLGRTVEHEFYGPHLVGCSWPLQRMAVCNRELLAPAPALAHLQACIGIQTVYALMVDEFTGLAKL